jgi:hypothetical protein
VAIYLQNSAFKNHVLVLRPLGKCLKSNELGERRESGPSHQTKDGKFPESKDSLPDGMSYMEDISEIMSTGFQDGS